MKKLSKYCGWFSVILIVALVVSAVVAVIYYRIVFTPVSIETFYDTAKVVHCEIEDETKDSGYISVLKYGDKTYILRGRDNYYKCNTNVNRYVTCSINRATYKYSGIVTYLTGVVTEIDM